MYESLFPTLLNIAFSVRESVRPPVPKQLLLWTNVVRTSRLILALLLLPLSKLVRIKALDTSKGCKGGISTKKRLEMYFRRAHNELYFQNKTAGQSVGLIKVL